MTTPKRERYNLRNRTVAADGASPAFHSPCLNLSVDDDLITMETAPPEFTEEKVEGLMEENRKLNVSDSGHQLFHILDGGHLKNYYYYY